MAINYDKPKAILITTCRKLHKLPVNQLNITVKGKVLENIKQEKLLSLVVDQNLSWNSHITKVHKTVSMLLARFRRIKPFLPTDARIKFCCAFILHHFDYCSTVWGSTNLDRLFKLQKRTAQMIFHLPTQTHTAPLLSKHKWMSLMDRILYHKAVIV